MSDETDEPSALDALRANVPGLIISDPEVNLLHAAILELADRLDAIERTDKEGAGE